MVDRKEDQRSDEGLEVTMRPALTEGHPVFKIDGRDLTFLKSVGIDPTRKLRRRRSN